MVRVRRVGWGKVAREGKGWGRVGWGRGGVSGKEGVGLKWRVAMGGGCGFRGWVYMYGGGEDKGWVCLFWGLLLSMTLGLPMIILGEQQNKSYIAFTCKWAFNLTSATLI